MKCTFTLLIMMWVLHTHDSKEDSNENNKISDIIINVSTYLTYPRHIH